MTTAPAITNAPVLDMAFTLFSFNRSLSAETSGVTCEFHPLPGSVTESRLQDVGLRSAQPNLRFCKIRSLLGRHPRG